MTWRYLRADRGEPVEGALQNISGRHPIDDFGAPGARDVILDQRTIDRGARQALVPEGEGRGVHVAKIAQERPRRLNARPLAAVHVERQADDQREGLEARDLLGQLLRVGCKLLALDGQKGGPDAAFDIGERKTDRLRAEVDADQPGFCRQELGEFFERDRAGGHAVALTCRAVGRHSRESGHPPGQTARVATRKRAML